MCACVWFWRQNRETTSKATGIPCWISVWPVCSNVVEKSVTKKRQRFAYPRSGKVSPQNLRDSKQRKGLCETGFENTHARIYREQSVNFDLTMDMTGKIGVEF